jgi:hypothetical protein
MSQTYQDERDRYLKLLHKDAGLDGAAMSKARKQEMQTTPLLSLKVKDAVDQDRTETLYPQYGILGYHIGEEEDGEGEDDNDEKDDNDATDDDDDQDTKIGKLEPILLNTNAPLSAFICGTQGAGKSFTMAAMLENCLLNDKRIGKLIKAPAAVVFHYDNDGGTGALAEAIGLCSHVKVKVLVSLNSYDTLKTAYQKKAGKHQSNVEVQPLMFRDEHLKIDRMHKLM